MAVLACLLLPPLCLKLYLSWRYHRQVRRMVEQLPPLLDHAVRSLKAGRTLADAVLNAIDASSDPLKTALGRVSRNVQLGVSLPEAVQDVADFIDKHGDSRFSDADALPDDQRQPLIHNRAGYWRNTDTGRVFLFTTGGMREALKGHDFGRALGYLQAAGMMPPTGSDGKSAKVMAIQGKRSRWYEVRPGAATGGDV